MIPDEPANLPEDLIGCFVPHLPGRQPQQGTGGTGLEAVLSGVLSAARAAWPEVSLAAERFLPYLAARVPAEGEIEQALGTLNASDLYVACACAHGDTAAIAALDRRHFREIDLSLSRMSAPPSVVAEVKQEVRQHLFVAQSGAPAITHYSGRGQLRRWIRVIAVRAARRLMQRAGGEIAVDGKLLDALPGGAADPEIQWLKRKYLKAFHVAFDEAMRALSSQDRLLLRQHFVDGLNLDQLAALHQVHRATAARWLARVRSEIASRTRDALIREARVPQAEYTGIMQLIRSQLDVSIEGYLRDAGHTPG